MISNIQGKEENTCECTILSVLQQQSHRLQISVEVLAVRLASGERALELWLVHFGGTVSNRTAVVGSMK